MSATQTYVARTSLPVSVQCAFDYHERHGALQRLTPPWEKVEIERSDNSLQVGSEVVLKARLLGMPLRWVAQHVQYDPPHRFAGVQKSGPFRSWHHTHLFHQRNEHSELEDRVEYSLPLGTFGSLFGSGMAEDRIEAMFAYRHRLTHDDLQLHADHPTDRLRVAISGSSGLVGSQLQLLLTLLGHHTRPIVRSPGDQVAIAAWENEQEAAKLEEVDAVVHLAGKPIAGSRWTEETKREIRDSRVEKTRSLCESLARLSRKPKVLVCASATGIYGSRGDELLDEQSEPGDDFLAEVASQWEEACRPAVDAGIRVVHTRFGLILSPQDGALAKMLLPAKLAGGKLGSGKQWWSWIAIDDALGAIYHVLCDESIQGPVNFVSPQPIRNSDFAAVLGKVIGRPALFPAPSAALRIGLGEMADALLLASTRVEPKVLMQTGYRFRFTDLADTLRFLLGYEKRGSAE